MAAPKEPKITAYVFFATAEWSPGRRVGWYRMARIARRRPAKAYHAFLSALTRWVTGSPLAHCAIGYNGVVLDPGIRGNRFWPIHTFCVYFPTLAYGIEVELDRPVYLDAYDHGGPKPVLPTLIRWWTGGRWRTQDCVCITCDLLRSGGVDVPKRIYQPVQLYRWLKEHHGDRITDFAN